MHTASRKPMSWARSTSPTRRASRKILVPWRAKRLLRRRVTARSCSAAKRSQSRGQLRRRVSSSTCSTILMRQFRPIIHLGSRPRRKSATNTQLSAPSPSKVDEGRARGYTLGTAHWAVQNSRILHAKSRFAQTASDCRCGDFHSYDLVCHSCSGGGAAQCMAPVCIICWHHRRHHQQRDAARRNIHHRHRLGGGYGSYKSRQTGGSRGGCAQRICQSTYLVDCDCRDGGHGRPQDRIGAAY